MDKFSGRRILINGDPFVIDGEPERIGDEYRISCEPVHGNVRVEFFGENIEVLRTVIGHHARVKKKRV